VVSLAVCRIVFHVLQYPVGEKLEAFKIRVKKCGHEKRFVYRTPKFSQKRGYYRPVAGTDRRRFTSLQYVRTAEVMVGFELHSRTWNNFPKGFINTRTSVFTFCWPKHSALPVSVLLKNDAYQCILLNSHNSHW